MKILKSVWTFLTEKKVKSVSEPITDAAVVIDPVSSQESVTVQDQESAVSVSDVDQVLSQLKHLLIATGHDLEETFDKYADLAKVLASKI